MFTVMAQVLLKDVPVLQVLANNARGHQGRATYKGGRHGGYVPLAIRLSEKYLFLHYF